MTLGENIRRARVACSLTQAALAEALGVSDRAVSRWENGTSAPDVALLARLALTLNVSADALLGVDPQRMEDDILAATLESTRLLNEGRPTEAVALLREKSAKYPNQPELMVYLAQALLATRAEAALQESLALCRAAERSGRPMRLSTTFGGKQTMALCLSRLGRREEAARLVTDEMPAIFVSRELLLPRVAPEEQAARIRRSNVRLLAGLLTDTLSQLGETEAAGAVRQAVAHIP